VNSRRAYRTGLLIAVELVIAASRFLAALGAWLVGSLWLFVATAVAFGMWLLHPSRRAVRLILAGALVPLLILLTWEGGLFYIPAALALVVAQSCGPGTPKPVPQLRGTGSG
jgi:hypothetical protein